MKIIRWLLSHTILILLIVGVIYGYMFWGNLLGENTPAGKAIAYLSEEFEEVAEFVDAVKAKQSKTQLASSEKLPSAATNSEDGTQDGSIAEPAVSAEVTSNEAAQTSAVAQVDEAAQMDKAPQIDEVSQMDKAPGGSSIKQQPVSISYSQNDMRIMQNSDGVMNSVPEKTMEKQVGQQPKKQPEKQAEQQGDSQQESVALVEVIPVSNSSAQKDSAESDRSSEKFVSVDIEKQLDNVDDHGKVIDASKNETLRESWIVARKSFYQRNYKLSEQSYLKVIEASGNNYDAYGELGNVYFNQGKNQQAASAYYEAAAILVRQGQISRARSLMGLLRHLDKSKAIELQELIDSPVS